MGFHSKLSQTTELSTLHKNSRALQRTMDLSTLQLVKKLDEKTVGIAKNLLQKCKDSSQDINLALLEYRNTPVDQIEAPSVLLMGRELRSILPTHSNHLKPCYVSPQHMKTRLRLKQQRQKRYYDQGNKLLSRQCTVIVHILSQQRTGQNTGEMESIYRNCITKNV